MSELQNQINEVRSLKKSYSDLADKILPTSALLTELENGKQEMVDALAMKNVQSSTDKTLSAIANDVRSIAQAPITIEGSEMYENQLFGAPTDMTTAYQQPNSPRWNLYKVMADLLSDGRFVTYGGIVLGEYPKGGDTIQLVGAGAGGAYLTSDGALYDTDTVHTWNDTLDGHSNRWVAYLTQTLHIENNDIASIYIGRSVNSIKLNDNTNICEIVTFKDAIIDDFNGNNKTTRLANNVSIKGLGIVSSSIIYNAGDNIKNLYIEARKIKHVVMEQPAGVFFNLNTLYVVSDEISDYIVSASKSYSIKLAIIKCNSINGGLFHSGGSMNGLSASIDRLELIELDTGTIVCSVATKNVFISHKAINKELVKINIYQVENLELAYDWCKPLDISTLNKLTEENIINHILKRLKQDEEMCGSGVTITLGATNLAKLTSEEAVALLDSLTNTYGYTFA